MFAGALVRCAVWLLSGQYFYRQLVLRAIVVVCVLGRPLKILLKL